MSFYHTVVHPKDAYGITNSVGPDQTTQAVCSGSALFGQTLLRSLQYYNCFWNSTCVNLINGKLKFSVEIAFCWYIHECTFSWISLTINSVFCLGLCKLPSTCPAFKFPSLPGLIVAKVNRIESGQNNTYLDQPAHPCGLITIFAVSMKKSLVLDYLQPKTDQMADLRYAKYRVFCVQAWIVKQTWHR